MNVSTRHLIYFIGLFFLNSCVESSGNNFQDSNSRSDLKLYVGERLDSSLLIGSWKFLKSINHSVLDTNDINTRKWGCNRNNVLNISKDSIWEFEYPYFLRRAEPYKFSGDTLYYTNRMAYRERLEYDYRFLGGKDTLVLIETWQINSVCRTEYNYYKRISTDSSIVRILKQDSVNWSPCLKKYVFESKVHSYDEVTCEFFEEFSKEKLEIEVPDTLDLTVENSSNFSLKKNQLLYNYRGRTIQFEFDNFNEEIILLKAWHDTVYDPSRSWNQAKYRALSLNSPTPPNSLEFHRKGSNSLRS